MKKTEQHKNLFALVFSKSFPIQFFRRDHWICLPFEMEKQIIEESKRLYDTKSGIIRRSLLFYIENKQITKGGTE